MTAHLNAMLERLSAITLGEVWIMVYNPPTPRNMALACVVLAVVLPGWIRRYRTWRESRTVVGFNWPVPKEAQPGWKGRTIPHPHLFSHLDDESLLPPETGRTGEKREHITCFDPSTGYHLTTLPLLTSAEISANMQRAHDVQPYWAETTFAQRSSLLRSIRAWVIRDMEGICQVACRDTGKTKVDAVFGEILTTLSKIDWLLKYGEKTLAPQPRPSPLVLAHKVSRVHYHPLGTVLALVSWNYSFHNLLSPLLAALYSGNTVILKCSEQVAWSSMWFIGGVKACLRACGFDDNIVQLVVCLPEVASEVTRNPVVKHITFIGSEPVGKKVAAAAAELMVPTCIELGGKDPAFLLPSVDIGTFASTIMRGVYQSAGQNCIGIELVLLPRPLLSRFLSVIEPRIKALRPGIDVGSLISHTPIERLETLIAKAEQQGARVLAGGKRYTHPDFPHASYFQPTLVVDVTMEMEIAQEELFAPVMSVVCYDTVDEAVGWLNASRFGLGASVFGSNQRECEGVAKRLQCGMVSINDFGVFYLNQAMPFGGVKASGHGRFGGEEGLRSLCSAKSIIHDRFFSLIQTSIPRPVDYPLPASEVSWAFLHGLVWVVYGSIVQRVRGLKELIGAAAK